MKIHLFYRHYNSVNESINGKEIAATEFKNMDTGEKVVASFRPAEFSFEKCWINLLQTIEGRDDVDIHLIMDGEIDCSFMSKYKDKFTLHSINAGSDQKSFNKTWEIAKSIKTEDDDIYYFLENDYLHVHYWVDHLKGIFENADKMMHYVSLYDHNDKYVMHNYSDLLSRIVTVKNKHLNGNVSDQHWRSTPSTCGSFAVNKQLFEADYDIQTTFDGDHGKFLYLNKERERGVWSPIPSLSTHMVDYLLAPVIDWNNYAQHAKNYKIKKLKPVVKK